MPMPIPKTTLMFNLFTFNLYDMLQIVKFIFFGDFLGKYLTDD